jgi:hypothetical protein
MFYMFYNTEDLPVAEKRQQLHKRLQRLFKRRTELWRELAAIEDLARQTYDEYFSTMGGNAEYKGDE